MRDVRDHGRALTREQLDRRVVEAVSLDDRRPILEAMARRSSATIA